MGTHWPLLRDSLNLTFMLCFFLFLSLSVSFSLPHYLSSQPDYVGLCRYLSLSPSPPSLSTLFFAAHKQVENNLSFMEHVGAICTARGSMHPLHYEDLGGSTFSHVIQRCQAPSHLHSRGDEPFTDMLIHHCNMTSILIKGVNWSHFLPALNELEEESHIHPPPLPTLISISSPSLYWLIDIKQPLCATETKQCRTLSRMNGHLR